MPSSWQKVAYTPPICIAIRLPFVSRYFCRSIRVRGRWDTPNNQKGISPELRATWLSCGKKKKCHFWAFSAYFPVFGAKKRSWKKPSLNPGTRVSLVKVLANNKILPTGEGERERESMRVPGEPLVGAEEKLAHCARGPACVVGDRDGWRKVAAKVLSLVTLTQRTLPH